MPRLRKPIVQRCTRDLAVLSMSGAKTLQSSRSGFAFEALVEPKQISHVALG